MNKKDVESAIGRFLKGERPFGFRRPRWYLITEYGARVPLKYIYAMASGLNSLDTHTDIAKKVLGEMGYTFVEDSGGSEFSVSYWWVNHKQTYQAELEGGYIWSPTKNSNGARNQTYINLTLVRAGDLVVSYAGGQIRAIGVATAAYSNQAKPDAFGQAGQNWSDAGWLVPVEWTELDRALSPKDHLTAIAKLLPVKNSPLQANGNGNQGCYLASISPELGSFVLRLTNATGIAIIERVKELEDQVRADVVEREIELDEELTATEREQLVRSRIGQGAFRLKVLDRENSCRLTGVSDRRFLIASHIKPWKDCSNAERLDGSNGLMLAPHVDKLFDRGWITFQDDGKLLVADTAKEVVSAWGLASGMNVGDFTVEQRSYLSHHRSEVYKGKLQ
ncbi:HNH endonuclease signature motif containing protein [Pseudomonas kermanshahensis]|uniref:HNH endonuclease n=1 Tax=Pseudomonas kermanshahensis TaxID=2745482 RepID=UPI0023DA9E99|nr:HNH endonuclease signature motif containing protein [Pseudomonas kermanshahensis]WEL58011.1 HNH endonuclease signature motif containing protein [Pseudomonas kermanshahensis]